jgi:hydroxymethylpyrimidine/phosphomethylpyrimidine kinase
VKIALTIAGSDSGGGAGVQADLRTFAAHGVHGTCAITAVTAQSTVEVAAWVGLAPEMVVRQIETVVADMSVAAAKTGMLGTPEIVAAVAACLGRLRLPYLVVDPVMVATSGGALMAAEAESVLLDEILPLATIVTPNVPEAEALLRAPVRNVSDMRAAARALVGRGAPAVLVKGGHLDEDAVDVFFDGRQLEELRVPRIPTGNTHGTGCTLSAAIAAQLANGLPLLEAVREAKSYVTEAIRGGYAVGRGAGVLDHLHALRPQKPETTPGRGPG